MGKRAYEDLTGRKFGRWAVLGRGKDKLSANGIVYRYWICKCSCDKHTIREVREYSLLNGQSKSCGCLSTKTLRENIKNREVIPDLVGREYGEWTVMCLAPYVNGSRYWTCICSCGTVRDIPERYLLNGISKSCGHIKDLTGKTFGRLTAIRRVDDKILPNGQKSAMWECLCECGNVCIVEGRLLQSGTTRSCGCLQRESQKNNLNQRKYNQYNLDEEYGVGYTANEDSNGNNEFWFDKEDYDKIKDYCWFFNNDYVVAHGENHKTIYLHKLIIPSEMEVDHIQHNKYDNRKSMLRIATDSQNAINKGVRSNNTSGTTGVSKIKRLNKWQVNITINGNTKYLGIFDSFDDAVVARKEAEEKYFGSWSFDKSIRYSK